MSGDGRAEVEMKRIGFVAVLLVAAIGCVRMPAEEWPDPVNRAFKHLNPKIYVPMQGPSELGASGTRALGSDR